MSNGLTSEELRQQRIAEISKSTTFETHGISQESAIAYLKTSEGRLYWHRLVEADPTAPIEKLSSRAIEQITSGRALPRTATINEPLVKIVPRGEGVSPYSPYFTKFSEFETALAQGHRLHDRFGLPIASESAVYDVYRITPKGPTEVFISEIAPTSELGGQVRHAGGAPQYLVPNRGLFTDAERVTSLGNDLALHHELVAGKGLGAPIAAAEAARGIRPGAGAAAKGLGALGVAATAYDIADTAHDVNRLHSQGNATAAEDRITRFAAQNLGGWGGAAAGMERRRSMWCSRLSRRRHAADFNQMEKEIIR